jgi:hypothetical protein
LPLALAVRRSNYSARSHPLKNVFELFDPDLDAQLR